MSNILRERRLSDYALSRQARASELKPCEEAVRGVRDPIRDSACFDCYTRPHKVARTAIAAGVLHLVVHQTAQPLSI